MNESALQIERQIDGTVNVGENVIFDSIIYSDGNISYNTLNGVITFQETGRYLINWWIATQSSLSSNGIVFTLESSQGDSIDGNSPIKTGEVYGSVL